mgnify:CR=1 FL=1
MRQLFTLIITLLVSWDIPLHAQSDEALEAISDEFVPGLIGHYVDSTGKTVTRKDDALSFQWSGLSPDQRLNPGGFRATWNGFLFTQAQGAFRIHAYVSGKGVVNIDGNVVLEFDQEEPGWIASAPIQLEFDWLSFNADFRPSGENGVLKLFWQGPGFQLEPISARSWFHSPDKTPARGFDTGRELVQSMRCARCHDLPNAGVDAGLAPELKHVSSYVRKDWIISRLTSSEITHGQKMPAFEMTEDDAIAVAAFLTSQSTPAEEDLPVDDSENSGDAESGKATFMSVGCVACHQRDGVGDSTSFDGGLLDDINEKRTPDFWRAWLTKPDSVNKNHRMPLFKLSDEEVADLVAFLTDAGKEQSADKAIQLNEEIVSHGKDLFESHSCASCHVQNERRRPIDISVLSQSGCVSGLERKMTQPGFKLNDEQQEMITLFVKNVVTPMSEQTSHDLLRMNNCIQCHARDANKGIAGQLDTILKSSPDLVDFAAALSPPSLNSVGDKLHNAAIEKTIRRDDEGHRPWLRVRMPTFNLSDSEVESLVKYLVDRDRIPDGADVIQIPPSEKPETEQEQAGSRLVTTDGFGCTSCHQIGSVIPPKAPLNAKGPNLSGLSSRIRKQWFDRWVRNPARIVPRMEMPSVKLAVRGVLDDQIDHQLHAVWDVLNKPGFEPPKPGAVRTVRRSGIMERDETVAILTDVIRDNEIQYIKPAIIGLPNRHNLLLNLQENQIAGWWQGDVARQRTAGKTWYWETPTDSWLRPTDVLSDLFLEIDGSHVEPIRNGQFLTELDAWRQIEHGIEIDHRLAFEVANKKIVIRVRQQFKVPGDKKGIDRQVVAQGIPDGGTLRIRVCSSDARFKDTRITLPDADGQSLWIDVPDATGYKRVGSSHTLPITETGAILNYKTAFETDRFPVIPPVVDGVKPQLLHVVPGATVTRLPFSDELMPTGLDWNDEGDLLVTSLKGRIWRLSDSDNDGLSDKAVTYDDELAAPFGIQASTEFVDVINKYALLRMFDRDSDGVFEEVKTLASGWGHTADYHDWTVGVVNGEDGVLFVTTCCEQDKRSLAAAHLRGKVLRLIPREPTFDDPRMYRIEVVTGGHRFPVGIAANKDQELFVTDNQGNWNPFNELNHVKQGSHFGFINSTERGKIEPPPLVAPTIDIPHPWTRSVNGICFLETPKAVFEKNQLNAFGPFEGHLIGCEYDTRRLIRMSLQKVGDTYQGAAYPFTYNEPKEGDPLLGPLACAVGPDGNLYIGCIRDSGWGGANNIGSIARVELKRAHEMPAGIAEVIARRDGFMIKFTNGPFARLDVGKMIDPDTYSVVAYTRKSTPSYGGGDVDRHQVKLKDFVGLSATNDFVFIQTEEAFKEGYVYEIRMKNICQKEGDEFFPAEAYYTMRKSP